MAALTGSFRWCKEKRAGDRTRVTRSTLKDKELGTGDRSVGTLAEFIGKGDFFDKMFRKMLGFQSFLVN